MSTSRPLPTQVDVSASGVSLADHLVQVAFAVTDALDDVAAGFELSLTQVRLLGILRDREAGMLELAQHLDLEKSSATGLIDRAQRRGLVFRTPGPSDGRTVCVAITPAGADIAARFAPALKARLDVLLDGMPVRDRARLDRLLGDVIARQKAR